MVKALVSLDVCRTIKGITILCNGNDDFSADPDVAGEGVLKVFASVTFLACVLATIYLAIQIYYCGGIFFLQCGDVESRREDRLGRDKEKQMSWFAVIENTLISLSDQQLFTGLAYAIALRYYEGCKISAYHYDIVTNMLLMTCATHLAVVAAVRNYFDQLVVAVLRLVLIFAVFVLTGLLFTNADASTQPSFPTRIPEEYDALFTYPAVCFQSNSTSLQKMLNAASNTTATAILDSKFDNTYVQNMNLYIVAMLAYGLGIFRLLATCLAQCINRDDRGFLRALYRWSQVVMLAVGFVVAGMAYAYISSLRSYMDKTGRLLSQGVNPENTATTFGQLVPILLTLLTLFTILQSISDRVRGAQTAYKTN